MCIYIYTHIHAYIHIAYRIRNTLARSPGQAGRGVRRLRASDGAHQAPSL